ncbi:MAG: CotH kinase family protein, partial [Acidobacteria bacterium]|nr:CotH kinase family protein [Acidobacteriota bacterium]
MNRTARKLLAMNVWLLVLACPAAAQTADDFFNDNILQEIRLDIRPADWANLKLHYLENTYYPADFHWKFQGRDIVVKDIGIRSRGRGSRSPLKPNLRLDFNRYEPGQKFVGLGSAVLKANNQDASELKERIVFKLFKRMGLPASREAHTRLYINDVYSGLYLLSEEIRKEYVERYIGGGEGDGDLYKWNPIDNEEGGYHFAWRPTCARSTMLACSTDSTRWTPNPFDPEENKSTFDIRPTIEFVRKMTETSDADFPQTIAQYTDLKLFLAHVALETYVADYDCILGDTFGLNNFFLYRYDNKNFHQFLLWDKDGSFDYSGRELFQNADKNVLMRRTLAVPGRRNQYLEMISKVAVLAGGPGGWMEGENQREFNQIKNALYEDPLK